MILNGRILSIEIRDISSDDAFELSIRIEIDVKEAGKKYVRCDGVNGLRPITGFDFAGDSMISIEDIKDRGWEQTRYSVEELIEHRVQFFCKSLSITP